MMGVVRDIQRWSDIQGTDTEYSDRLTLAPLRKFPIDRSTERM